MMSSKRSVAALSVLTLASLALLFFSACGGGGGAQAGGLFTVISTDPADGGRVFLNQPITFVFSNPIDISTASFNSVSFDAFDSSGDAVSESVTGSFQIGRGEDGEMDEHVLEFVPRLPTNNTFTNGGFKPSRFYKISLVGANNRVAPTVRDKTRHPIHPSSPIQGLTIRTVDGATPQELFRDTALGGPRVVKWEVGPLAETGKVSLNRNGEIPVEVSIRFNQPLNPSTENVPLDQDIKPRNFKRRDKGRLFLEYDDPLLGENRWIPAQVELAENDANGSLVVLRPEGVLPNNATIEVIVEPALQDLSGESNLGNPSYERAIGSFETETAFEPQFDAVAFDFHRTDLVDPKAAFRDPVAAIKDGILTASFEFEGLDTFLDFEPTSKEVVLKTDFAQVQPSNGPPITVVGGVFSFHDIVIPVGVRVQGAGPNPLVLNATGKVDIHGHLTVDGGDGAPVHTLNSANFPTAGGQGACTGGNGGKASQSISQTTQQGETGFGPFNRPGQGGKGGKVCCTRNGRGGGGGGGSFATQGDPDFYGETSEIIKGMGGRGSGTGVGGPPGPKLFFDEFDNNDFWGRQIDDLGQLVIGELKAPHGGAGGGGGGDVAAITRSSPCNSGASYISDRKGGGGGAAAGVLVIKALGPIRVTATGEVTAVGGAGGGGEWAGSSRFGGGGGGGGGGMVILMSATRIELETHEGRWHPDGGWDSNFSISADGGFGSNGSFGGQARLKKYTGKASAHQGAPNRGGFGGLGVVQLMTPPGNDKLDGTNTVQDDNIFIRNSSGNLLKGKAKTDYIFSGDIRPDPLLMPVPFSRYSQMITRWINTGATIRREADSAAAGGARSVNRKLGKSGPEYFFSGTIWDAQDPAQGYLLTDPGTGRLIDKVAVKAKIVSKQASAASVRGQAVHVVNLEGTPLPDTKSGAWSYENYRARLTQEGRKILEYRIVGHTTSTLFLDARDGPLAEDVDAVEVLPKFYEVFTGLGNKLTEGLGPVYTRKVGTVTQVIPKANVQIGWAFHLDPSEPDLFLSNNVLMDRNRIPQAVADYVFDLDLDNATRRSAIRDLHYRFVQMQVRFNLNYNPKDPDNTPGDNPVGPRTERPRLMFIRFPYRF
ncbi:MAG: Ig-like domain-containing protein [Planctomycetota bacterium]